MGLRGRENLSDPHTHHTLPEGVTVDWVAVAEEVGRCGLVGEGIHDLLGGPVSGGMLGHVEMDDPPAVVSEYDEYDENEEHTEAGGRDREEVEGNEIADMVRKERAPGLRWSRTMLRHQPGDGALGNVDAELEELGMDSRGTPEWIRPDHSADQGFDRGADGWPAASGPGGERCP